MSRVGIVGKQQFLRINKWSKIENVHSINAMFYFGIILGQLFGFNILSALNNVVFIWLIYIMSSL